MTTSAWCMQASAATEQGTEAGQLAACKVLFAQLPWEEVSELDADSIREGVRLPLLQYLITIAGQASLGNSDAADLVHSVMTVWHKPCRLDLHIADSVGPACLWPASLHVMHIQQME